MASKPRRQAIPAPVAPPPQQHQPAQRHQLSERFADADLVDRLFEYMLELVPGLAGQAHEIKQGLRAHVGAGEHYVKSVVSEERRAQAQEALRLFNGRNASEVARRLNISRASVYRYLKQAGQR